jgi:hypothetical protein
MNCLPGQAAGTRIALSPLVLATGTEEVLTMDERARINTNVVLWVVVLSFVLLASWLRGFPWNWW